MYEVALDSADMQYLVRNIQAESPEQAEAIARESLVNKGITDEVALSYIRTLS